ncbi:MAG: formylmethanofuran dehydrogenase subunit A [Methanopyri archaeon]|jgi:formylmethanofuran dehydrogenase subunit A|nr:formylmethanofuran dehydrogenase subunit A [Methanopyri archaeon]
MSLVIENGTVYDPANGIDGEQMDIFIKDGKIVEETKGKVIDATGLIVFPGGLDIHTHISGGKVNLGRLFRPEDHRKDPVPRTAVTRAGVGYSIPTTYVTGYRYATMGYTTVMEPAITPLSARHTHEELNDTPILDKAAYTLLGNNHYVMHYIKEGDRENLKNTIAWFLGASKGYAVKLVNPGGVENWKWGRDVESLDDPVDNYEVTPRDVLAGLARANDEMGLPHPIHVHANNLGMPGNYETTIETINAVKDRIHLTHLQFQAYTGDGWRDFGSGMADIAKLINKRDNVTCDMGQVLFDETTTMTADGPAQHHLYRLTGNKWMNSDVEMETGAGIVPYRYLERNPVNAVQWAIGLEVALMITDPWKVSLTTDHPNGGPFYHYPKIISWLMSKKERETTLGTIHKAAAARAILASLDREYSLYEIAVITRAATAKTLGLTGKGHLGIGADADLAIYRFSEDDIAASFARTVYTIKDGRIVVKNGEVVDTPEGRTYWIDAGGELTEEDRQVFTKYYTMTLENYPVQAEYLPRGEAIRCGGI